MLEVKFPSGEREISVFGLTQWDKGQKLALSFDNMPKNFQVHFSSRGSGEAVVVEADSEGGTAVVDIPDEMLINDSDVIAWIYLTGENSGETVGKITMYVRPRPRPKGFMEELVPSQQQIVENMLKDIKENLDYVLSKGVDSEYAPQYVKDEAAETASKILACQNENSVSFFLSGDYHYDLQDENTCRGISHMASAMKLIRSMCKIDFGLCLGGYIADRSDKSIDDAKKEFLTVNKALSEAMGDMPCLRAVGGDDLLSSAYYRNGDYFDCNELYTLIGKWCNSALFNPDDKTGGYCYIDIEKASLRVICLNTSDFKKSDAVKPETNKAVMSAEQLKWLCSALDLSKKENRAGWSTIIVSHYPVNFYSNFVSLRNIIKAYISGSAVDFIDSNGNEISYDFSRGNNSARILALFNGALHNLKVNVLEGTRVPLISIPNACFGNNNYFADEMYSAEENLLYGESATWDKTASGAEDTAFCVATLDKSDGKMTLHCYGAGYDREIEFDGIIDAPPAPPGPGGDKVGGGGSTGSGTEDDENGGESDGNYTNLVPTSTDEYGDVFNRCGYRNGQLLDEAGEPVTYSGFAITGYIEASNGDTVRIKGGNWSSADGNIIHAYDEDYCLIWSEALSGTEIAASGISYNGSIAVFESLKVTTGNISDMAYIRISCSGDGEALVVTLNENIPSSGGDVVEPPVTEYENIIKYATDEYGDIYNKVSAIWTDISLMMRVKWVAVTAASLIQAIFMAKRVIF